jgi:tetratricopeptide (TPR) repeat protein
MDMDGHERELWESAARCYVQAGELLAAGRCLERAGRHSEAAALYESAGAWREAARAHARAGAHRAAARCHEAVDAWAEAAQSYQRAGDITEAAWLLAHALGWHANALQLLGSQPGEAPPADAASAVGADLVRARCDAASGRPRQAARVLAAALASAGLVPEAARTRLRTWAVAVADALARPDLGASAHAAFGRGSADDIRVWEAWAQRVLRESAPYPGEHAPATAEPPASPPWSPIAPEEPAS